MENNTNKTKNLLSVLNSFPPSIQIAGSFCFHYFRAMLIVASAVMLVVIWILAPEKTRSVFSSSLMVQQKLQKMDAVLTQLKSSHSFLPNQKMDTNFAKLAHQLSQLAEQNPKFRSQFKNMSTQLSSLRRQCFALKQEITSLKQAFKRVKDRQNIFIKSLQTQQSITLTPEKEKKNKLVATRPAKEKKNKLAATTTPAILTTLKAKKSKLFMPAKQHSVIVLTKKIKAFTIRGNCTPSGSDRADVWAIENRTEKPLLLTIEPSSDFTLCWKTMLSEKEFGTDRKILKSPQLELYVCRKNIHQNFAPMIYHILATTDNDIVPTVIHEIP